MGNIIINILAIIITLLLLAAIFIRRSFKFWKAQGVYTLPPSVPFGNASDAIFQKDFVGCLFKKIYDIFKKRNLRYGGYYCITKPIFVLVDLDLVKQIIINDFSHFTDHVHYINSEKEPLTADLASLRGTKWKQLRSKLSPTFSSGKMKMMFGTVLDCTEHLRKVINEAAVKDEAIDMKDVFSRFTTDVIGSCAFGFECNCLRNPKSEFKKYADKYFHTSSWHSVIQLLSVLFPELLAYMNVDTIGKDIHDFFMDIITKTVEFRENNNISRRDFLQLAIQLKNSISIKDDEVNGIKSDVSITMNELAAQCFFFFIAGYETSSTAATFLIYELTQNLEMQEKLRDEITTIITKHNGEVTYEAIMEMHYLDKCISETLRKYPPISILSRECTKDYLVPNSSVLLKKGSAVFIPVLGIHRDPDYYPNPEIFDPERFSEENKATRHQCAWIPFGDGPRVCIALRFGIMQTKLGIIALLREHSFTLNLRTSIPLAMDPRVPFVLTAKDGVWVNVKKFK